MSEPSLLTSGPGDASSQESILPRHTTDQPLRAAFDNGEIIIDPWSSHEEGYAMRTLPSQSSRRRHTRNNSSLDRIPPAIRTQTVDLLTVTPNCSSHSRSALKRSLHWIHIFMISFGATVGMGYYVKTGTIHRIGGSSAVVYSYILLGLLSFAVMHPLTNMLRIWPVRAPLMSFVEVLVNKETGLLVGILYWMTYCFSYAALTTAIGELFESLHTPKGWQVACTFGSLALPLFCNLMDIRYFKKVELFCGTVKLLTALVIIIMINSVNETVSSRKLIHCGDREDHLFVSEGHAKWFGNLCASLFLASFAFVGIEVVAATAPEASLVKNETERLRNTSRSTAGSSTHRYSIPISKNDLEDPFRLPAILVPLAATTIYTLGGWIVSQSIASCDERLPSLAWETPGLSKDDTGTADTIQSSSIFVLNAGNKSSKLANGVTALLIVNLISTSSTALFVASRSLFGLATKISSVWDDQDPKTLRESLEEIKQDPSRTFRVLVRLLASKNQFDVPYWAVWGSCWLFWVPTLRYKSPGWASQPSNVAMELGSVCCILVWACESFAAFRLYRHFHKYPSAGEGSIRDRLPSSLNSLNYKFHRNVAFLAFLGCIMVIILGGTFTFIHDMNPVHGVSVYLIPIGFLSWTGVGYCLKNRGGKSTSFLNELNSEKKLREAINSLDRMREFDLRGMEPQEVRWYNLWGVFFCNPLGHIFR